jgi:acetyl-CoA carboxylase carboxyl transferase beta subunit/acetyl-CoA carboxylase carboxyl transferase alpha subunit
MATPAASAGPSPAGENLCPRCSHELDDLRVCASCGLHAHMTAMERIESLADRGSFQESERHLWSGNPIHFSDAVGTYDRQLVKAQSATGLLDAVVTGRASVLGVKVVLIAFDFGFLGGSMGGVVGEKVSRAFEAARRQRLPAIVVCSTGGARIQEGMVALFQMAKTALAAARLREQGVPLLAVFADPTMGGVLASFASLADIIIAEPGARVSFVGPRVHEKAAGDAVPPGTAEFALGHGSIDAIVERRRLRPELGQLAGLLRAPVTAVGRRRPAPTSSRLPGSGRPVWETVELARHPERPSGRHLATNIFTELFELHGDRAGEDDSSVVAGIGRINGRAVMVVAQDRFGESGGRTRPGGYRKALRAFTLAERFGLPLVTFVDTPGAATDEAAEAAGITGAVAESLARLSRLRTRVVSVVVGEGGSGGALALALGDRMLMMENAIFSVIGPEAASTILYRDADHAHEVAEHLKLAASDLLALHLVDVVVPEQPAGHEAPDVMVTVLRQALIDELEGLDGVSTKDLLARRETKFRHVGALRGRWKLLVRPAIAARREA